ALAQEASLLLLDEPLAGLDAPAQQGTLALLGELHTHGITSIVALHELDLVEAHFPRVLLLNRKTVGFGAPGDVFTPDRLRRAYGSGIRIVETASGPVAVGGTCCEGDEDGRD
ncbi:MAG: manganese ABC transporter ATP-binding protein, partial [Candidatus Bipolaricaulota bacterium]